MRITGGEFRSRPLRAPKGERTRPTSDRVREAMFSMLVARGSLEGARVLDLYAGTGALALEALSRVAAHATLVEEGREALAALRANINDLGVTDRTLVLPIPVERAAKPLARTPADACFDLIFADPPYKLIHSGEFLRAFAPIVQCSAIAPGATVVVEHASADSAPTVDGLTYLESRRHGDTTVSLYRSRI